MSVLSRRAAVYEGYADTVTDQEDTARVRCCELPEVRGGEFVRRGDHCGNWVAFVIWLWSSFQ